MLHYIIQTIAFQLFFLVIYDVFLKKETFFNWNRAYLLVTSMLSLVLPFIKINSFSEVIPKEYVVNLPQVVIGKLSTQEITSINLGDIPAQEVSIWSWELLLYIGMAIALMLFLLKMSKLAVMIYKNPKRWKGNLLIVKLIKSSKAFSFFHYIFLGEKITPQEYGSILQHEEVHAKQKHTLDLLYFEVLRILFWFNPLIYMYQNRMAELHEFIADAKAVKFQNKEDYYENLLSQVFETQNLSFINPFFKKSLIKKRIVMLSKQPSKQKQLLKYALLIPILLTMLVYTSTSAQEIKASKLEDNELYEKLKEELYTMKEKDATPYEIINAFSPYFESLKPSKEAYYRAYVYKEYSSKEFIETMVSQGLSETKITKTKSELTPKYNYREYLQFMKTSRGLKEWANKSTSGVIKQIVENIETLTDEEQAAFVENKNFVFNEKFIDFYKLIITDGESTKVFENSKKSKRIAKGIPDLSSGRLEVPFAVIEQVPIYPGCEELSPEEQKNCMSKKISEYVSVNFNTKLGDSLGLVGRVKINTIFKVNKEGVVEGIRVRAPHPKLEKEAIRIISGLPQMKPGMQKAEPVIVPYSLPIIFEIKGKQIVSNSVAKIPAIKSVEEYIEVPFAVVEQPPVYPGCEDLSSEEQKKCTSNKVSKHILKNFNIKLAGELGLQGRQRINVVFKVNKEGDIEGIKARAPHPKLEKEASRVISGLPQMRPGKQKGKVVTVPYSLPIIFEVQSNDKKDGQDPSDDELLQKGYDEILKMEKLGVNFFEFSKIIKSDNYIKTREEFHKFGAYLKLLNERIIKTNIEKGKKIPKRITKTLEKRKTYKEYLEYKKTQEAKDVWENSPRKAEIRLIVGDLDNMTSEEKRRYDYSKAKLDNRKKRFYKFLISDGKETKVLTNPNKKKPD